MSKSDLESELALHLRVNNFPEWETEYRFHPKRKWRFDMAWPGDKLGVEIDGGVWSGGRHTRGDGFIKDCEKLNEAVILGWRVIRVTADQIRDGSAVDWLRRVMFEQGAEVAPYPGPVDPYPPPPGADPYPEPYPAPVYLPFSIGGNGEPYP